MTEELHIRYMYHCSAYDQGKHWSVALLESVQLVNLVYELNTEGNFLDGQLPASNRQAHGQVWSNSQVTIPDQDRHIVHIFLVASQVSVIFL